jgi:hypothetical protein
MPHRQPRHLADDGFGKISCAVAPEAGGDHVSIVTDDDRRPTAGVLLPADGYPSPAAGYL